jgi:hypothetical protein
MERVDLADQVIFAVVCAADVLVLCALRRRHAKRLSNERFAATVRRSLLCFAGATGSAPAPRTAPHLHLAEEI